MTAKDRHGSAPAQRPAYRDNPPHCSPPPGPQTQAGRTLSRVSVGRSAGTADRTAAVDDVSASNDVAASDHAAASIAADSRPRRVPLGQPIHPSGERVTQEQYDRMRADHLVLLDENRTLRAALQLDEPAVDMDKSNQHPSPDMTQPDRMPPSR